MQLGQNTRQRFVNHQEQVVRLEQFAVFLDGQIAVVFLQHVVRIGGRLDVALVIVDLAVNMIQQMVTLKFRGIV